MKKGKTEQHTNVLMLPVDVRRAEELATYAAGLPDTELEHDPDESMLLLLFGIASIEDSEHRQTAALAAGRAVYCCTRRCENDLARYMAELYQARE